MIKLVVDKNYKNISEVSAQLNINKHVIRYWDSKFDGISTRLTNNKRRFFNSKNIDNLKKLKNILYENGKHNYSLDLAKKLFSLKSPSNKVDSTMNYEKKILKVKNLQDISENLKKLLNDY
tara:strand:+ start:1680 stop:2042 length:363 start_codon:yes stop_codon:yes gene_type:complete